MADISTLVVRGDSLAASGAGGYTLSSAGRAELKYAVPGSTAEAALDAARPYLPRDVLALGSRQQVTSLYLDTAELTFLRWHRERAPDRFKLRIRCYGEQPAPMLYAEVKRKTSRVVRKLRAPFPAQALHAVLNRMELRECEASRHCTDDLQEFIFHRSQFQAVPRMLVTGVRESLRDPDDGTAVTVDHDLRYQPTCRGDLTGAAGGWQPIPLPGDSAGVTALVELKFAGNPPAWMLPLIVRLTPWRVSFSKYAAAMNDCATGDVCGYAPCAFRGCVVDPVGTTS